MQCLLPSNKQVCTDLNLCFLRRRRIVNALSTASTSILLGHLHVSVPLVPSSLKTLHLPRLHRAEVLLAHVNLTRLVTHAISINVLLRPRLRALWLLERSLHHVCIRELFATKGKVQPGAHFLDFDARQLLARALCADEVEAQFDFGVGERVGGLLRRDADEVLQALYVDFFCVLALEKVDEQALCERVLCLVGILEDGAVEGHERLQADRGLLVLELLQRAEGIGVDVELEHIEDLVGEGTCERHAVGALLRVKGEHYEGGVVLEREELESCLVLVRSVQYGIG
jgi:hypothetical protein